MPRPARLQWMDAADRIVTRASCPELATMLRQCYKSMGKQGQMHAYLCPVCSADVITSARYLTLCIARLARTGQRDELRCVKCERSARKSRGWTARARAVLATIAEMYPAMCREATAEVAQEDV